MFPFVVVVVKIISKFLPQGVQVFEDSSLVKFFFHCPVESLNLAVLGWLARVSQIMVDAQLTAQYVKTVSSRIRQISRFFVAGE